MKKHLMTIALILLLCLSVPAYALTFSLPGTDITVTIPESDDDSYTEYVIDESSGLSILLPDTEDGLTISNVEVIPTPEHYLEECAKTIPDKEQTLIDIVKCFFLVDAIQVDFPGGAPKSELKPYIDFLENDESIVIETDRGITFEYSDNFEMSLLFAEDSDDLITQAVLTLTVEDVVMPDDFCYTITVQF